MKKERANVGDIRMNKKRPEICVDITYTGRVCESDTIDVSWDDYEEHLFHTRMGMFPGSNQVHTLQYFVDVLNENQPIRQKSVIKIRYAYIPSSKDLPAYPETLKFKVFSLEQLETQLCNTTIKELITNNSSPITIKGRDICTARVDMDSRDIYTSDIIRWVGNEGERDEIVTLTTNFYELETSKDCKVIGTIYDKDNI